MMKKLCDGRVMRAVSFSVILLFGKLVSAEENKVSWYSRGEKQTWQTSNNIAAYKIPDGSIVPENFPVNIVKNIALEKKYAYQLLKIWVETEGDEQIKNLNAIISQQNTAAIPLHTLKYDLPQGGNKDIFIDNQILVQFQQPYISASTLQQFCNKYHLEITHQPSEKLNSYGNYTYIFTLRASQAQSIHPAALAGKIYEENRSLINEAHPNMLNIFESDGHGDDVYEIAGEQQNALMNSAWHIGNNGQSIFCNTSAQQIADTKIEDVWNLGYKGQQIRVGIIDVHGFDFNHPDMRNQLIAGWNFIKNEPYNQQNFYASTPTQSHGMAVAGIIAANGEAKGVSHEAKIVPFLVDLSEASIIQALQKAMQPGFDVDVLNCSFSGTGNNPLIEDEIINLTTYGRNRFGSNLGVVIVCSSGNDNTNDEVTPMYPAGYEQVICVTATTPSDKRKDINDQWNGNTQWAPNYGKRLHVGAPGLCIPTTDYSGATGYSQSNYITFSKTSSAAPVVSGLSALLLSKNQDLTWQEVKQKIADGADKVGNYNYDNDADKPGHSTEIGYGRINALNTLESVAVGIDDKNKTAKNIHLKVENPVNTKLNIHYDLTDLKEDIQISIYNMEGKIQHQSLLHKNETHAIVDVSNIPSGMYFTQFYTKEEDELLETVKFVKLW